MTQSEEAHAALQQRVKAAEERNRRRLAGQSTTIGENAANAVKDHPFASLATGVAAGILLASLLPKGTSGRGRAVVMGMVADLGLNLARSALKNFGSAQRTGQGLKRKLGRDKTMAGSTPPGDAE